MAKKLEPLPVATKPWRKRCSSWRSSSPAVWEPKASATSAGSELRSRTSRTSRPFTLLAEALGDQVLGILLPCALVFPLRAAGSQSGASLFGTVLVAVILVSRVLELSHAIKSQGSKSDVKELDVMVCPGSLLGGGCTAVRMRTTIAYVNRGFRATAVTRNSRLVHNPG